MSLFTDLKCIPCRKGSVRLSAEETARALIELQLWQVVEYEAIPRLVRVFKFKDFALALAFANRIAEISAMEDHHPALLIEWGRLSVSWYTHTIGGLHQNDLIMAAKTDQLYQSLFSNQP